MWKGTGQPNASSAFLMAAVSLDASCPDKMLMPSKAGGHCGEERKGAAGPDSSEPAFSYKQEPTGLEDEGERAAT